MQDGMGREKVIRGERGEREKMGGEGSKVRRSGGFPPGVGSLQL
jgi:hypothetical protein